MSSKASGKYSLRIKISGSKNYKRWFSSFENQINDISTEWDDYVRIGELPPLSNTAGVDEETVTSSKRILEGVTQHLIINSLAGEAQATVQKYIDDVDSILSKDLLDIIKSNFGELCVNDAIDLFGRTDAYHSSTSFADKLAWADSMSNYLSENLDLSNVTGDADSLKKLR